MIHFRYFYIWGSLFFLTYSCTSNLNQTTARTPPPLTLTQNCTQLPLGLTDDTRTPLNLNTLEYSTTPTMSPFGNSKQIKNDVLPEYISYIPLNEELGISVVLDLPPEVSYVNWRMQDMTDNNNLIQGNSGTSNINIYPSPGVYTAISLQFCVYPEFKNLSATGEECGTWHGPIPIMNILLGDDQPYVKIDPLAALASATAQDANTKYMVQTLTELENKMTLFDSNYLSFRQKAKEIWSYIQNHKNSFSPNDVNLLKLQGQMGPDSFADAMYLAKDMILSLDQSVVENNSALNLDTKGCSGVTGDTLAKAIAQASTLATATSGDPNNSSSQGSNNVAAFAQNTPTTNSSPSETSNPDTLYAVATSKGVTKSNETLYLAIAGAGAALIVATLILNYNSKARLYTHINNQMKTIVAGEESKKLFDTWEAYKNAVNSSALTPEQRIKLTDPNPTVRAKAVADIKATYTIGTPIPPEFTIIEKGHNDLMSARTELINYVKTIKLSGGTIEQLIEKKRLDETELVKLIMDKMGSMGEKKYHPGMDYPEAKSLVKPLLSDGLKISTKRTKMLYFLMIAAGAAAVGAGLGYSLDDSKTNDPEVNAKLNGYLQDILKSRYVLDQLSDRIEEIFAIPMISKYLQQVKLNKLAALSSSK